ncbi:hypothetical protein H6F51_08155 [Cyanobacteria bacterium FACHB-DQ100]|uniref:hypothetical protein n=1 Tax=unclassified Leptolyngbya TaxID=2650499 RepID=UPI00168094E7|nr:hypothetical protein [Leptolyngbya sp. FACHB-17]MBD1822465.1 hypothetical protein [Cyanobacteria bacterium FACHB-DQ100]MBD2080593.1 hypothetical protein [Leptolyngbya sp. FACHB-17]
MDFESRSRRNFTYVMWMLGTAFMPVGLSFEVGSFWQILFLGAGVILFLMGHFMYRDAWNR